MQMFWELVMFNVVILKRYVRINTKLVPIKYF
jgi:hypothetical protein